MSDVPMSELRFTDTNSADDSQGKTWGLEGNLFWYLVLSGFLGVIVLLLMFSALRWTLLQAAPVAVTPMVLALLYIFLLRQGKPPGYDRDLIEGYFSGVRQ